MPNVYGKHYETYTEQADDFRRVIERAGLLFLQMWDIYIVWKQGGTEGWLMRLEGWSDGCWCSDCFPSQYSCESTRLVYAQIDNIGLQIIAVGVPHRWRNYQEDDVEHDLHDWGISTVPPESSEIYKAFISSLGPVT